MQDNPPASSVNAWRGKVAIPKLDRAPPPPPNAGDKSAEDRVQVLVLYTLIIILIKHDPDREPARPAAKEVLISIAISLDLSERVNEDDQKKINDAIEEADDDFTAPTPVASVKSLGKRSRKQYFHGDEDAEESGQHGEAYVTASVGSNEDLDNLNENILRTRESRETGYIGQNSEVQWLRSVQRQAQSGNTDPTGQRYGPPGNDQSAANQRSDALHERRQHEKQGSMRNVTDATFYLDSDSIEVDIAVDPYEIPDPEIAEQLFNCYVRTVHSSFPLLPQNYEDQFRRYLNSVRQARPFQVPEKWRAIMNLVFAIGAKYSHLTKAEWRGDDRDHLIYMTRAVHLLGLKDTIMIISGPDLSLVEATGLLSFYFLVIGHVSRAWIMIGISMRLALALGLHLRNEDRTMDSVRKESLQNTWWSLHAIECLVSSVTGRPPVIAMEDCTVAFPHITPAGGSSGSTNPKGASRQRTSYNTVPTPTSSSASASDKRPPTDSRYFVTHLNITFISHKVLLSLYSPRTAAHSWQFIQRKITELLDELEQWSKASLPTDSETVDSAQHQDRRERFMLRMYYWSTKILITRPCLCRIERRIANESNSSENFNSQAAETCVDAARELTKLFPDQPDPNFIYASGPWWTVVHIIMQSMAVLLLEMAYRGEHLKDEKMDLVECIKKLIRWLRAMQIHDLVAARAYQVVWRILKTCAPSLQSQANELLAEEPESAHQSPPVQPFYTSTKQPYSEPWQPPYYADSQTGDPAALDPRLLQQESLNPLSVDQYDMLPYSTTDPVRLPQAFGNLFVTSFDQGAPVVNMQNLWPPQKIEGYYNMPFFDMNLYQNQQNMQNMQGQDNPDTQYSPPQ
ncbi:Nn.00g106050.m01.CDS01 [Neocucurbitaria sp. VM-36]